MDFLRLYLPGLHQALRGALDSFSTFVSYLIGDAVPTVEKEAHAAEEPGVGAAGRPGKIVEEEAQEALEGLTGGQSEEDRRLGGPGEGERCQGGGSATEQTWGWGDGSFHGSRTNRQDAGAWESAKVSRCQEPTAPLKSRKKSEAGSGTRQDRNSQTQERQESDEQEVNRGESLRTWEQEKEEEGEEEEVRTREPGMARRAESKWTWNGEPEGKAADDAQKVAGDSRETEQVVKEATEEETERCGAGEFGREGEVEADVRAGQRTRAQEIQSPGEESEEVWMTSCREEVDLPGVREIHYGPVPGERIPEATGRVWVLEEASKGNQEEAGEKREADMNLFLKYTQALGPEAVEKATEGQTAGREAAGGQVLEKEARDGLEGSMGQYGKGTEGRPDLEVRAERASLEEVGHTEETLEEKGRCWVTEAELSPDKEAEDDVDLERTIEASCEEELMGQRNEMTQMSPEASRFEWGDLKHKVTEGQEPEQMGGIETPTKQPEEGQSNKKELWRVPALSKEETERSMEDYSRRLGCAEPEVLQGFPEALENQSRDMERGHTQEEKSDGEEEEGEAEGGEREAEDGVGKAEQEEGKAEQEEREAEDGVGEAEEGKGGAQVRTEEAAGVQALEATPEAQGGRVSELQEVLEAGGDRKKAQEREYETEGETFVVEIQELNSGSRPEVDTGLPLGKSDIRETKHGELEAAGPQEADRPSRRGWSLEGVAMSLQDMEDTQTSTLAAEMVEDKADLDVRAAREQTAWERESGKSWDSEGRGEAIGAEKRDGQDFGLEGSAEEEVASRDGQAETFEAREGEPRGGQAEAGESVGAEGHCRLDHLISGSGGGSTEIRATVESQGLLGEQMLLEKEAGGWQAGKQREDSEGKHGDHHLKREAQRPSDKEEIQMAGGQTAAEMDPEDLGNIEDQEEPVNQDPAEAVLGPCGDTETTEDMGSDRGDSHSNWSEALLPGSRLDVSVPRSRVLLSRSSSQRRSRPSFRRTPAPEQQEEPSSPQEGLSTPEQSLLQLEEPPELRPLSPEGTPVPVRRRPLGQGFGLAHPGMMQELQARLGQPKPQ
ncbi:apolipoprotein B receptor isoform X2 [Nycticebus coucang]|uniref:apolipoprotein B receptor isoform X2 n=1 Tax=Nycticebus coucang TaxID=9470 RepID=UPI00234DCA7B|nr:apolipoprotein B receptor isoform X2 [Nycticebus coucang]